MRTLALGAHCDDLAFSIGGAFLDGRFGEVLPVTVFTRSGYTLCGSGDPAEVTPRRKGEDRRFFRNLPGVREPLWLDRLDAPLRLEIGADEVRNVPFGPEEEAEADAVAQALLSLSTAGADLLAPLALGGHIDHRVVRKAATKLAPGRTVFFYEDLPYAGEMSPDAIAGGVTELTAALEGELEPLILPSAEVARARERAVASYRSQADGQSFEALMRHPLRLAVNGLPAERVWRFGKGRRCP